MSTLEQGVSTDPDLQKKKLVKSNRCRSHEHLRESSDQQDP